MDGIEFNNQFERDLFCPVPYLKEGVFMTPDDVFQAGIELIEENQKEIERLDRSRL